MVLKLGALRILAVVLGRDVVEPPLSFQDLQPHVRSWVVGE